MTPEVLAAFFTGLNALVLVYFQARRGRRDELLEDMEALREERAQLHERLGEMERSRDEWRERYYAHLGEAHAVGEGAIGDSGGAGKGR